MLTNGQTDDGRRSHWYTFKLTHGPSAQVSSNERNQDFSRFSCKSVHISTNSSILEQQITIKNELPTVRYISFNKVG